MVGSSAPGDIRLEDAIARLSSIQPLPLPSDPEGSTGRVPRRCEITTGLELDAPSNEAVGTHTVALFLAVVIEKKTTVLLVSVFLSRV